MLYKNQNRWQIDKGNLEQLTYIHVDCRMSNHCFRGPQENLIGGKDFKWHTLGGARRWQKQA